MADMNRTVGELYESALVGVRAAFEAVFAHIRDLETVNENYRPYKEARESLDEAIRRAYRVKNLIAEMAKEMAK